MDVVGSSYTVTHREYDQTTLVKNVPVIESIMPSIVHPGKVIRITVKEDQFDYRMASSCLFTTSSSQV